MPPLSVLRPRGCPANIYFEYRPDTTTSAGYKPYTTVEPTDFAIPDEYMVAKHRTKEAVKVSMDKAKAFVHEDVSVLAVSNKQVSIRNANWEVNVTRRRLWKVMADSKIKYYLDVR